MAGSHGGGGGHSGGSHSYSSTGGNSTHIASRNYYPGALRYVYYNHLGQRCFFYSNVTPTKKSLKSAFAGLLFGIIIAIFIYGLFFFSNCVPKRINSNYQLTNYVYDNIDVIDDNKIEEILEDFYNKSGVQAVIYTQDYNLVENTIGVITDTTFTDYAYEIYYKLFKDEYHWLICYAQDATRDNFYWAEIYGDNVESVITESLFESLQSELQSCLTNKSVSTTDSFIRAYNVAYDNVLTWDYTKKTQLILGSSMFALFAIIMTLANISTIKQYKKVNEYCDYREKKNNGVDNFEKVDPDEFKIDPNDY